MSRTPAELAREVRDWISGPRREVDALPALAALAELQALAEAGQHLAEALAFVMKEYNVGHYALTREQSDALAAASPSPADTRHGRDCPCTACRAEDWDAVDERVRQHLPKGLSA